MSSNPTLEHAEFDLYFHARMFAADDKNDAEREGLRLAALEYARASGYMSPEQVAKRDTRQVPPIFINSLGTAVAAKELADAMEESRAQLLDALREIVDADEEVENYATPRWNAALDRARSLLRGH